MQTPPPINKPKKNKAGLIILIVVAALIILCVVIVLVSTSWAKTPEGMASLTQGAIDKTSTALSITIEPTNTPKPENTLIPGPIEKPTKTPIPTKTLQPTITPTPTKELSSLTFEEIKAFRENATDLQWDAYKKTINGKRVQWSGTINNVDKSGNQFMVWVCMDSTFCLNRSYFTVEDPALAMELTKGQLITFDGIINTFGMDFLALLGFDVMIDNAVILSK